MRDYKRIAGQGAKKMTPHLPIYNKKIWNFEV